MENWRSETHDAIRYWNGVDFSVKPYHVARHCCRKDTPSSMMGRTAISICYEDNEGHLWAGHPATFKVVSATDEAGLKIHPTIDVDTHETISMVNYCPFCGFKAPTPIKD